MTTQALQQCRGALAAASAFIRNGVAFGYIRMPDADCPDSAHETPRIIEAAILEADAALIPPAPKGDAT